MIADFKAGQDLHFAFPMCAVSNNQFASGISVSLEAWTQTGDGDWVALASPGVVTEIGTSGIYEVTIVAAKTAVDQIAIKATGTGVLDSGFLFKKPESLLGSGADLCTVTIEDDGTPVENARVWVSTDEAGTNVVAGSYFTDANGQVPFMLTAGNTYYLFAVFAGKLSIIGREYIAVAD